MFQEPFLPFGNDNPNYTGWIEVICGSMFSGKTEELLRRVKRAEIAGQKVKIFKPEIDTRYSYDEVVSHSAQSAKSVPIKFAQDILLLSHDAQVIGIDEAQFFDNKIIEVANELANSGKRVVIAGLDMDSNGNPFGPMPHLMAIAEFVTKVHAVCVKSGGMANYSFRKSPDNKTIKIGEKDLYEPRSRKFFWEQLKEKRKGSD